MVPRGIKQDQFNYESGSVQLVKYDLEFSCTRYESPQINEIGKALLNKYKVLQDYLDFNSGYTTDDVKNMASYDENLK